MKLVHLADLHLGFSRYDRVTPAGVNQLEADVAAAFTHTIDRVIAVAPDVVVVGGDVFHSPRPSVRALVAAYDGFARLVAALPETPVVIAAGNHDLSKTTGHACALEMLARLPGVHVADRESKRFTFPSLGHGGLSVLAVPDAPGLARPLLVPDATARVNVLVMHGEVQGMLPKGVSHDSAVEISCAEIGMAAWDYVALGHYHVYRALAANCYYAGSIAYTSSNPWGELTEEAKAGLSGKGFGERNLITGEQAFHALPAARPWVDLPAIDAHGLTPAELDAAIAASVESYEGGIEGGIAGTVARVVVHEVTRSLRAALDQKAIRRYKAEAVAFTVDTRAPVAVAPAVRDWTRPMTPDELRHVWGDDPEMNELLGEPAPAGDEEASDTPLEALVVARDGARRGTLSPETIRAMNGGRLPYGMDATGARLSLAEIRAGQEVRVFTAEERAQLERDQALRDQVRQAGGWAAWETLQESSSSASRAAPDVEGTITPRAPTKTRKAS